MRRFMVHTLTVAGGTGFGASSLVVACAPED